MEAASVLNNQGIPAELRARRPGDPAPDLRGVRLNGADLSGCDLSGLDLTGAQLGGANLSGARFVKTILNGASLFGANVAGSEFLFADLAGADLTECRGEHVGFGSANLSRAVMFEAQLPGSTFTGANLTGADLRAATLKESRFREANLTGVDFSNADLTGADLESSRLSGACLRHSDLRGTRLRGCTGFESADWIDADIMGVDFTGAFMARRFIMDQNYLHEFRSHSRSNEILYRMWWITSDCGRSFLRWGLWTLFLAAVFAGLFQFVAMDYGDHQTFLSSFYFSVVTLTTLGYGDVLPASAAAQVLAMVEVALGYVMLGRGKVETLLISLAVRNTLPRKSGPGYDNGRFWATSARRAVTASALADIIDPSTRSASFTASLLQDMALPLLSHNKSEHYGPVLSQWHEGDDDLSMIEQETFGWDHTEVGAWMCAEWRFPENLAQAIANHHGEVSGDLPAVSLVSCLREVNEGPGIDRLVSAACRSFGIPEERTRLIIEKSFVEAEDLARLFV